jgi:hypothetical protein
VLGTTSITGDTYKLGQTTPLATDPVAWSLAQQGRPTLTGGMAGGRVVGVFARCALLRCASTNDDRGSQALR